MASSSSKTPLPSTLPRVSTKLNSTNHYLWRNVMTPLLEAYELLGYADGSLHPPAEKITLIEDNQTKEVVNPEYREWLKYDKFALTCILIGVEADVGVQLLGVSPAREAWSKLAVLFDSETVSRFDFLNQQWRELRKANLPMGEYLKEIGQLTMQFALTGHPQSVAEIDHRILSGLSEEWEPLILSLTPTLLTMTTDSLSALLL